MNSPKLIVFPAADLAKSKALFTSLTGTEPYADTPYYVGFRTGDIEIGLDPRGQERAPGALVYWDADDIKASIQSLTAAGAQVIQDIQKVAPGLVIAILKDPAGTLFGLRGKE